MIHAFKKLDLSSILIPLSLGLIALSIFSPHSSLIQFQIAMLFVILYISVALMHHYLDKSLTPEAIFEYILIATLVVLILTGTLI